MAFAVPISSEGFPLDGSPGPPLIYFLSTTNRSTFDSTDMRQWRSIFKSSRNNLFGGCNLPYPYSNRVNVFTKSVPTALAKSAWDIRYLNRKIFLFQYQIFNHIFFVINFSYFVIRFLLDSSIVKSDNEIGKLNDKNIWFKKLIKR